MKRLLLTILILLACAGQGWAATVYVDANDSNGDDSRTYVQAQNPNTPWKTFRRAEPNCAEETKVVGGDTVLIKDGNYTTTPFNFDPTTSGRISWATAITYKNAPGHTPVINGRIKNPLSTDFHVLYFYEDYSQYLIFDGLTFKDSTPEPNLALDSLVELKDADHIKIVNCIFTGRTIGPTYYRFVADGSPVSPLGVTNAAIAVTAHRYDRVADYITISNNKISNVLVGIDFTQGTASQTLGAGIEVNDNEIYNICGSAIRFVPWDACDTIEVHHNNIHSETSPLEYQYVDGVIEANFVKNRYVRQVETGAAGIVYSDVNVGGADTVRIGVTSDVNFRAGYDINDANGVLMSNPTTVHNYFVHASGISIKVRNIHATSNTIRSFGSSSGIMSYTVPQGTPTCPSAINGYTNLDISNNLLYDLGSINMMRLDNLGSDINICNNTVIGYHYANKTAGRQRYGDAFRVTNKIGLASSSIHDIRIYNNLVVGQATFYYSATEYLRNFDENDNIFWSALDSNHLYPPPDSNYFTPAGYGGIQGKHTYVVVSGNTQASEIFESGFFVDPNFGRKISDMEPIWGGSVGNAQDYNLVAGALAINFGGTIYAPTKDLINRSRVGLPDAGALEYQTDLTPSGSDPCIGIVDDVKVLSFGNVNVGEDKILSFSIEELGNKDANITLTVFPDQFGNYVFKFWPENVTTRTFKIADGAEPCVIEVNYTPTLGNSHSDGAVIRMIDFPQQVFDMTFEANGIGTITVTPDSNVSESVVLGQASDTNWIITGTADQVVTITLSNSIFTLVTAPTFTLGTEPCTVTVRFNPLDNRYYFADINFSVAGGVGCLRSVSGRGLAPAWMVVETFPSYTYNAFSFTNTAVGQSNNIVTTAYGETGAATILIYNSGDVTMNWTAVVSDANFAVSSGSGNVSANGYGIITASFNPFTRGNKSGIITLSDGVNNIIIPMSGTAIYAVYCPWCKVN
jgi:hypothetical protein